MQIISVNIPCRSLIYRITTYCGRIAHVITAEVPSVPIEGSGKETRQSRQTQPSR